MYGDSRISMSDIVSGLVQPVVGGKVDMAMVEYSDKVWLGQAGRVFCFAGMFILTVC